MKTSLVARWAGAVMLVFASGAAHAEVMLFRGDHVYLIPIAMSTRMLEIAPRSEWHFFSDMARGIDEDGDGHAEFHAVALGADGGWGAQVRYRFGRAGEDEQLTLGRWYWGVITDAAGQKVFEVFNQ